MFQKNKNIYQVDSSNEEIFLSRNLGILRYNIVTSSKKHFERDHYFSASEYFTIVFQKKKYLEILDFFQFLWIIFSKTLKRLLNLYGKFTYAYVCSIHEYLKIQTLKIIKFENFCQNLKVCYSLCIICEGQHQDCQVVLYAF